MTGSDLTRMDEETVSEFFGLGSKLVVEKVTAAIRNLVGFASTTHQKKGSGEDVKETRDPRAKAIALSTPTTRKYLCLSHAYMQGCRSSLDCDDGGV